MKNQASQQGNGRAPYTWVLPWQVRDRRFKPARFGCRGLDPDEVQAFLNRVADDLGAAYNALAASRQENARIIDVMRRWQRQQDTGKGERPARHRAGEHLGRRNERSWR